jgi:hypothetical protein
MIAPPVVIQSFWLRLDPGCIGWLQLTSGTCPYLSGHLTRQSFIPAATGLRKSLRLKKFHSE